jgi:hypothetical protein
MRQMSGVRRGSEGLHEDQPKSLFDHAEVTSLVLLASNFALRLVMFCVFRSNGAFEVFSSVSAPQSKP